MKYIQCFLENKTVIHEKYGQDIDRDVTIHQTSWLPEEFAKYNLILMLKNDKGEWEDGWRVKCVYASKPLEVLPDTHIQIKKHEKRTGDSMPKKSSEKAK